MKTPDFLSAFWRVRWLKLCPDRIEILVAIALD